MPSPFPGMNPYIERETVWHDFHESFMPEARQFLAAQVLPRYFVKIDEHVYIHELQSAERRFAGRGDVTIAETSHQASPQTDVQVLEAPQHVRQPAIDVERLSFLEVRDRESHEIVTVIEMLSPANKRRGEYRDQYLAKCTRVLSSSAHFVEIDLLRGGPRMPWRELPKCDYYGVVSRVDERPSAGIWPIGLRERLPIIPIPLRAPDGDAKLDLQLILDRIYDAAGYQYFIYTGATDPPLAEEDAEWAKAFVPTTE